VSVMPFRVIPGDGRKPGDRPRGVPDTEKKFGFFCIGVDGVNGADGPVPFLGGRFRGDSMLWVVVPSFFSKVFFLSDSAELLELLSRTLAMILVAFVDDE
jgi:hypothetical protein